MSEQEQFEKWAKPDSVQARRNPETGDYMERGMVAAFNGWMARAKLAESELATHQEALRVAKEALERHVGFRAGAEDALAKIEELTNARS